MATAKPLLTPVTKIRAPELRRESITRKRLQLVFQVASQWPLTVVRAPAGYGKTTAVVQWLKGSRVDHAWLSLDSHGDDPQRFVGRLLAALDRALPGRLEAAERALQGGSDLRATVIPLIAEALSKRPRGQLVIVLDDYQEISNPACHWLMRDLIDALPSHVRAVVASRTAPPLGLARRRAAQALSEIGPEQLRFTLDETTRMLNGPLGLGLHSEQLDLIERSVQGWAAGLALIGVALAGRRDRSEVVQTLTRSRANLDAYLTEEVLDAARPQLREFLTRTSILTRLCAPLCEAVLEDPEAGALLDEVVRSSLFVTALDQDGTWLRYHDTFSGALRRELQRLEPQLISELHRRASTWFEQAGMTDEAIEHALQAGDAIRAATLLAESWLPLAADRRYVTMRRILDRLPNDLGDLGPLCKALDIDCTIYEGVDQRIVAERAERLLDEHGDDPRVRRVLDGVLINPFHGDVGRALELGREAWQRYASAPTIQADFAVVYALVLWFADEPSQARSLLEPQLQVDQPSLAQIWTLAMLAMMAADDGDVDLAERYARQAMADVEAAGGQTATEFAGVPLALAEALRLRGQLDEARVHLNRALENEARRPGSVGHAGALIYDTRLALAEGDRRRARRSARRARQIADQYRDLGTLERRLAELETELDAELDAPGDNPLLGTPLNPAESRVLRLLDSDLTRAQIAAELGISHDTVKSHIRRLYRRLGEHSRTGALAAARKRGLLADGHGLD